MGASGVRRGPGEPPIEDPRRVTQTDDGFTILQAFEGDDIDDALRGIARVLRRDLTEDDLSLVTSWLRTVDPALAKLRHRGGAFVDVSDELLERRSWNKRLLALKSLQYASMLRFEGEKSPSTMTCGKCSTTYWARKKSASPTCCLGWRRLFEMRWLGLPRVVVQV